MVEKREFFNGNLKLMSSRLGIYADGPEYMKPKEYLKSAPIVKNDYLLDGLNDQSLRLGINGGYRQQERMIFAWDEFRRGTNIKVIGFPLWLDSFGLGIDDDKVVFDAQGYDDMPQWKKRFLENNRKFYIEHREFIDMWVEKYDMTNKIKLYKKFEWKLDIIL